MLFRFTRLFVAVGLLAALWLFLKLRPDNRGQTSAKVPRVKILQFYASTGVVARGETALLCYGVENARAVRVEPPIEDLKPSPNRCVPAAPEHTTHYTLLAEGFDGTVATQSFTLNVGPPLPPAPRILHFAAEPRGNGARLCYDVVNAARITLEPAPVRAISEPKGCVDVMPRRTTTYTLTVFGRGKGQREQRQIVVEVGG